MKNRIIVHNIQIILYFLFASSFSVFLSYTYLAPYFQVVEPNSTIEIIGTARKNHQSYGTDIRISNIWINEMPISFSDFHQEGDWALVDDTIFAVLNPSSPVSLTYSASDANIHTLKIEFQKQEGSGIVRILHNQQDYASLDLYSPDPVSYIYEADFSKISLTGCWPLFVSIFSLFLYTFLVLPKSLAIIHSENAAQKFFIVLFCLYLIFLVGCLYYKQPVNSILSVFLILSLGISSIPIREFKHENKKNTLNILLNSILMIITSILIYHHTESIMELSKDIDGIYLWENLILYMAIQMFFYLITRRLTVAIIIAFGITYSYAVANYYVTLFRGSPILPADFFTIRTAGNVALNYHYVFTWNMFRAIINAAFWGIIIGFLTGFKKKDDQKTVLFWTLPTVLITGAVISLPAFNPQLDFWNLKNNIRNYGLAVSFVAEFRQMKTSSPAGYSYDKVQQLYNKYESAYHENTANQSPHIIVIMNEAFSDLGIFASSLDVDSYLPYYHSLSENTIKGQMLVSTHGGGTANTEYEFLTGNSMGFIPGTIPYQQFVLQSSPSLPKLLKERGYHTTAIHPYDKSGYGRARVYPFLGFDEFFDIHDFEPKLPLIRDRYISDADSYRKVIEVFEKVKKRNVPAFIFNVTMQNHGDYLSGYYGNKVIRLPEYEGRFPDVEEYLTLIKESDNALLLLVEYFSQIDEPVIIILFGDHQPNISLDFYESFIGKPMEQWTLEEAQKRFVVPFFIWTNFEIEEKNSVFISANYLSAFAFQETGINLSPYQRFLLKLRKSIPAMNMHGYLGHEGKWHEYSSASPYTELLSDYWMIQYNNIFAKKKYSAWFED